MMGAFSHTTFHMSDSLRVEVGCPGENSQCLRIDDGLFGLGIFGTDADLRRLRDVLEAHLRRAPVLTVVGSPHPAQEAREASAQTTGA